jgi:beta-carotene hydroxylase
VKAMLAAPRIAWPTLATLVAGLAMWCCGLAVVGHVWPAGFALSALGAYLTFTPMHEAIHRSLGRSRLLCAIAGRLAVIPLFGPFPAVRYIHLEHHKHTNDPALDPDHWSGRGPRWLLPLRWLTQDLHYYVVYLRRPRPLAEYVEVVATYAAFVAVAALLIARGHATLVLLGWVLPARFAIGMLAFAFDYLPHRPHQITAHVDRFAATRAFDGRLAYIASLGQSMHLVHHLYPGVPFYRYTAVRRAGLVTPGAPGRAP